MRPERPRLAPRATSLGDADPGEAVHPQSRVRAGEQQVIAGRTVVAAQPGAPPSAGAGAAPPHYAPRPDLSAAQGAPPAPLLRLRGILVRRDGRAILDVPALDVAHHEVLAILGPNGAGKSTLLQVMALLLAPDAGEVRFAGTGVDARRSPVPVRRRLAVVFQEPLLFDTSVFENVASGLRLRGVSRCVRAERVAAWLARLGIAHLRGRSARTLSGGEARRVSLARALVLEPELLLLDEPFGALDYNTRQALLAELPALLTAARTTTILVTHDPTEARALASRAIALDRGQMVADGAVSTVLAAVGLMSPVAAPPRER